MIAGGLSHPAAKGEALNIIVERNPHRDNIQWRVIVPLVSTDSQGKQYIVKWANSNRTLLQNSHCDLLSEALDIVKRSLAIPLLRGIPVTLKDGTTVVDYYDQVAAVEFILRNS